MLLTFCNKHLKPFYTYDIILKKEGGIHMNVTFEPMSVEVVVFTNDEAFMNTNARNNTETND